MQYADASFAGDTVDSKSTTGGYLFLLGPNTCVPLGHITKKQGAVSHSSTEAEIVALDACMRVDGIPALILWEQVVDMFDRIDYPNRSSGAAQTHPKGKTSSPKNNSYGEA